MTPFQRLCRNVVDRLRQRYYEGPEPPKRYSQEARVFAALHPQASAEEWKGFASRLAENAYREGFTRGLEWNERLWPGPAEEPEVLADRLRHDWSLPEERVLALESVPSPILGMRAEDAYRLQHQLAHVGARIVPLEAVDRSGPYPRRPR